MVIHLTNQDTRGRGNSGNRRVTKLISEEIFWIYDNVVPIGEGMFFYFLNSLLHYLEFFKKHFIACDTQALSEMKASKDFVHTTK